MNWEKIEPRIRDNLRDYLEQGLFVIPFIKGSKIPLIEQDEYRQKPTEKKLEKWFSEDVNIGVLCGKESGGLIVIDFDEDLYERFYPKKEMEKKPRFIFHLE